VSAPYAPPLGAIARVLGVVGLDEVLELPPFGHLAAGDVEDVLAAFGRFAAEVIAPTDSIGDHEGAHLDQQTGEVTVPRPLRDALRRWVDDGWPGLAVPIDLGGGGFPEVVGLAADEIFATANLSLSLNPMLTEGAIQLLSRWATARQKKTYVELLVSGRWSATMDLTEPDAGSDLGAIRTRATLDDDGRWRISGTKVFITWGEHDVAENIVHLVLARTPGSPPGTKGLSLFVVPRQLVDDDGSLGMRNAVRCIGVEHKLGIHGSPTCMLEFDGAIGELVGREHSGMEAMFMMMNFARLSVALQGLAVAERAHQQALAYALDRRQGRAPGAQAGTTSPIIEHPDVRRMLLLQATSIDAMRLLLYSTAATADVAHHHPDTTRRAACQERVDLLTPVAKAWCTDEGVRVASLAVQVHGGSGYVEETGVAQRYRDSRIGPIYEGTNGIQAIDLVQRKVCRDGGCAMRRALDDASISLESAALDLGELPGAEHMRAAVSAAQEATEWMVSSADVDRLAGATPYLELIALTISGGLLAKQAVRSVSDAGRFGFFAVERLSAAQGLLVAATAGADRLTPDLLGCSLAVSGRA